MNKRLPPLLCVALLGFDACTPHSSCEYNPGSLECQVSPILVSVTPRIAVPDGGDLRFSVAKIRVDSLQAHLTGNGCPLSKPEPLTATAPGSFLLKLNKQDVGTCQPGEAVLQVMIDGRPEPLMATVHLYQPPNFAVAVQAPVTQLDAYSRAVFAQPAHLYVSEVDKNNKLMALSRSNYQPGMTLAADALFNQDTSFRGKDARTKVGVGQGLALFYGPLVQGGLLVNQVLNAYMPDDSRTNGSVTPMLGDGCLLGVSEPGQHVAIANAQQVTQFTASWNQGQWSNTPTMYTRSLPAVAGCPNANAPGQTHIGLMLSDFGRDQPGLTSAVTISHLGTDFKATICGPDDNPAHSLEDCLTGQLSSLTSTTPTFTLADVDGDKLPDLVYVLQEQPKFLHWIPFAGAPDPSDSQSCAFGKPLSAPLSTLNPLVSPSSISVADVDGNGLPDLAVAHQNGVTLFLNQRL